MESLRLTDDYSNLEKAENIRVTYDRVNDKVWFETPLYEWVDLGLPSGLKWASTNVGASKPEEIGLYFAWGETEGYTRIY